MDTTILFLFVPFTWSIAVFYQFMLLSFIPRTICLFFTVLSFRLFHVYLESYWIFRSHFSSFSIHLLIYQLSFLFHFMYCKYAHRCECTHNYMWLSVRNKYQPVLYGKVYSRSNEKASAHVLFIIYAEALEFLSWKVSEDIYRPC